MENNNAPEEIVRRLLKVISRQLPMSEASKLLAHDVRAHMDGWQASTGQDAWGRWVRFLHAVADRKMSDLDILVEHVECRGETVSVSAKWRASVQGKVRESESGEVTYRLRDGKIVEIQTHKRNYVFIFGKHFVSAPVFWWTILRLMIWSRNCPHPLKEE